MGLNLFFTKKRKSYGYLGTQGMLWKRAQCVRSALCGRGGRWGSGGFTNTLAEAGTAETWGAILSLRSPARSVWLYCFCRFKFTLAWRGLLGAKMKPQLLVLVPRMRQTSISRLLCAGSENLALCFWVQVKTGCTCVHFVTLLYCFEPAVHLSVFF